MTNAAKTGFFGACAALLVLASCFVERPVTRLSRAGIEIRRVEAFEVPSEQHLTVTAPGDYVLSGPGLRAVIGGLGRDLDARGAVLEMRAEGAAASDSVVLFRQTLYVDGVEWGIRVNRMYILEREGTPRLRIEGSVLLDGRVVEVAREVSLGRVRGTLSITTRVFTLNPDGERRVRLGARLAWGGPHPFIPGLGTIEDEVWHRADWVGGESARSSLCFGFERGALAARASFEDRGGVKLLLHADLAQAETFDLARGVAHYEKSALVFEPSGLSASVRNLGMWRGRMFPESWAYLPYQPDGSAVQLFDEQQRPLLTGRPDEAGRVVLPSVRAEDRAPLRYVAVATAYGHAPSDPHPYDPPRSAPFSLQIPRGGQIRLRVRESQAHEPIPFRLRLLPLEETPPPALGPDYRASGAGDTVVTVQGQTEVRVPSGRYRAMVTHGLEWSLYESELEVTETFSPLIDTELDHQVEVGDWVACDLHVHAEPSPDSEVRLDDRLISLAAEGVGFAVATDHNHVTDYRSVLAQLPIAGMAVESGVEVTTWDPHLGHFNAYPFPLDPSRPGNGAPAHTGVDLHKLFRSLHQLDPDLVVQINHPRSEGGIGYFDVTHFDPQTGAADARFSAEFDAVEVFNGFDLARRPNVDRVFADWLAMLARGKRVVATGSSDSHQVRYQLAGYPRTYANVPEIEHGDARAIIRAIKAGATFVTSGPFVEVEAQGGGPGTTVSALAGKVRLSVRVQAPDWMPVETLEVFVGTQVALSRSIPAPPKGGGRKARRKRVVRLDDSFELDVPEDSFIVVRVSSQASIEQFFGRAGVIPLAFTNPIFVDADGDGKTRWSVR